MTVRELREALAALPDGLKVVVAKDAEGNSYSPLAEGDEGVTLGLYTGESAWAGGFLLATEDEMPNAVCLWPVN